MYGEIEVEGNWCKEKMEFVEIDDNSLRCGGVSGVSNGYECEGLLSGCRVIGGGVRVESVGWIVSRGGIRIREKLIEYGGIGIRGGSNGGGVWCSGKGIGRGGILLGE